MREYLAGRQFDDETIRVMGLAFEMTRAALPVDPGSNFVKKVIAQKIIDLVDAGEPIDADHLCQRALAFARGFKYY